MFASHHMCLCFVCVSASACLRLRVCSSACLRLLVCVSPSARLLHYLVKCSHRAVFKVHCRAVFRVFHLFPWRSILKVFEVFLKSEKYLLMILTLNEKIKTCSFLSDINNCRFDFHKCKKKVNFNSWIIFLTSFLNHISSLMH